MCSSVRRPRSSHGIPSACASSRIHPAPAPTISRPPDSVCRFASCFAFTTGLRYGSTWMLVPSFMRLVHPGDERQARHRLQPRHRRRQREVARLRVRVLRLDPQREHDVVAHPRRVVPHLLDRCREPPHRLPVVPRPDVRQVDAELHALLLRSASAHAESCVSSQPTHRAHASAATSSL